MKGYLIRMCHIGGVALAGILLVACAVPQAVPAPPTPVAGAEPSPAPPPQAVPAPPTPVMEAPPSPAPPQEAVAEQSVTLTWYGQSMFTLEADGGPAILLDPTSSVGYAGSPLDGIDVVTVSHEHSDHNEVTLATGSPIVLRGLAESEWAEVDETIEGVHLRSLGTYHDDSQGSERGKNGVFIIEAHGLRVVHLGDLGHLLSPEQVGAIGSVDVLMVPVGGFYTIDAAAATEVMQQLEPRLVVPMHYKMPETRSFMKPVDDFLKGKTVERRSGNQITLSRQTLPQATTVLVMGYQ